MSLPVSRRAHVHADRPQSLGDRPMPQSERQETAQDVWHVLVVLNLRMGPPRDDRDCPPGPCPHVGCRHHLYLEIEGPRTVLNFPGRQVDELRETCSLRVAREAAGKRRLSSGRAMTCAEVGALLNCSDETIRTEEASALRKLAAVGVVPQ